jgi:A/G-specific adenine glycosylase
LTTKNLVQHSDQDIQDFINHIWHEGKRLYRDLEWRNTDDPYAVLVSEVMLQQTQVKRVQGYWPRFLSLFPTLDALAVAESSLVLEQWQGLGYNRRALSLKKAAEICATKYGGLLPRTDAELQALPGIGPATAAGIRAFAYREPSVYIETNVRTVFIHHFFPESEKVKDADLYPLVEKTCSQEDPRSWYYALLDYGAFLKQDGINPSRRSAHHTIQSSFEGSRRQKRAEILRCVLAQPGIGADELYKMLSTFEVAANREKPHRELFDSIVNDMLEEGFFRQEHCGNDDNAAKFFA